MRITGYIAAAVIGMTVLASCLEENDMAYPHVYAEVLSFGVEGQESVKIDAESRTVSVEISETAQPGTYTLVFSKHDHSFII